MSFGRDGRFRDHETRYQQSLYARQTVPSPQHYQAVGVPVISTNKSSTCGTTFGASARAVLCPTNHTVQGKVAGGFALHRKPESLSPRPCPGSHKTPALDKYGRSTWLETRPVHLVEADRLKAKINLLNYRLSGDLPHETHSDSLLKQRRQELVSTVRSLDSSSRFDPSETQGFRPPGHIMANTRSLCSPSMISSKSSRSLSPSRTFRPRTAL
mmetsp:Transcript_63686/g.143680  ORF Transcript_63686/g.143680 Transcript_63686/m.143680 type:complete len:213 (+) Transcript_63686:260-898(+)